LAKTPRPFERLTPRERDIAAAVCAGLSNREIAARLGIQEKTVRNRLTALFEKVGVRTRLQLAVLLASRNEER
jgi:DNA-binding NarL/FixJ family response regulator